ncbi:uncharacterized protein LOC126278198 [Schistocerca gregaria]|uniref:uncharacterized protein LOC126278198 n=1 Tax=Schistocerca gregaria TaxID=7010 RepID=UPI00211E9B8C|nr:uncharacterized protein LOC126278198 [Schistocerca gregaria]
MWTTLQLLAQVPGPRSDRDKVQRWLDAAVSRISAASRLPLQLQTPTPLPPAVRPRRRTHSYNDTTSSGSYQWLPQQITTARGLRLMDRQYMLALQRRTLEKHLQAQRERIQHREAAEREREKQLALQKTPPFLQKLIHNSAMGGHPGSRYATTKRRLQAKRRRRAIRAIEDFWLDRDPLTMIAISAPWPPQQQQQLHGLPAAPAAEDDDGTPAPPDIQKLLEAQTLEEMYALAEEILRKKKAPTPNQRPGKHSF